MEAIVRPSIDNIHVTFRCNTPELELNFSCIIYPKKHILGLRNLKLWRSLFMGEDVTIDTTVFSDTPLLKRQIYPVITQSADKVFFTPYVGSDCLFKVTLPKEKCSNAFFSIYEAMTDILKGTPTPHGLKNNPELLLEQLLLSSNDMESLHSNADFLREQWA